ncbi:hypothetical protein JST56_07400 [Candidatus Dependentiae bacterium]|jgi:hypothetical protein|nr:hypothetical protein [Candidatus Dependentiae bacterium]
MKKNISALFLMFMIALPIQAMKLSLNPSESRTTTYISNTLFRGYYFARYRLDDAQNEFKINIETDRRVGRGSLVCAKKCNDGNSICEISEMIITQDHTELLPLLVEFLSTQFACTKCIIHITPEQEELVHACLQVGFTVPDKETAADNILIYSPRRSSV